MILKIYILVILLGICLGYYDRYYKLMDNGVEMFELCQSEQDYLKTSNYFFDINAGEEKSVAATKTFVLSLLIILKLVFYSINNKDIN